MASELKRRLDYSDLAASPDDGKIYELVRGELLVSPSPSPMHQRVSKRLQRQLEDYFESRELGEVFNAPIDVILSEQDVFVPDLIVVAEPDHISKRGIESPPVLVVEILSPSSRRTDRGVKARRYAELGVRHYWIVDPDRRRLECHQLSRRTFRPLIEAEGGDTLDHPAWDGLSVNLAALWR
ncbi:MAG: Uma2 family endonuclease [bacterium]|nr:Uma2 family endonuclease [bacterium]